MRGFWTYLVQISAIALAFILVLLALAAGGMALDRWNREQRAEQAKERCIAEGYKAVPYGTGYWCR